VVLSAALPTQDHRNPVYCNFVLHSGTRRGPRTEQMQLHQRPHVRIWEPANAAPNAARLTPIIAGGRLRAVHACSVRLVQIAHATKRHFLIDVAGNIRLGRAYGNEYDLWRDAGSRARGRGGCSRMCMYLVAQSIPVLVHTCMLVSMGHDPGSTRR
jgi:hypothetical protein